MKKNLITRVIVLALIVVIIVGIASCGKRKKDGHMDVVKQLIESGEEDVMLFDYFRQVVGTEETQGYFEIVLYAMLDEEGKLSTEEVRMDVYTDGGLRTEKMESSVVPYAMFEKAMELAKEYKMDKWPDMDEAKLISIDGCLYVIKLPAGNQYLRVSSESMPKDGMEAFDAVLEALQAEYSAEN